MTAVDVRGPEFLPVPPEGAARFDVASEGDPTRQVEQIARQGRDAEVKDLVEFVRSPEAGSSTLVRVTALDMALGQGLGKDVIRWSQDDEDTVAESYYPEANCVSEDFRYRDRARRYIWTIARLAKHEHVDEVVFDPGVGVGDNYDWAAYQKNYPIRAAIFLDKVLFEQAESPEEQALFDEFRPFAQEVNEQLKASIAMPELQDRPLNKWEQVAFYAHLTQYGAKHSEHMAALIDQYDETMTDYLDQLMYIFNRAHAVGRSFPDEVSNGVGSGIQQLTADALYAIVRHVEHGEKTDVTIPLSDQLQLPYVAEGEDIKDTLELFKDIVRTYVVDHVNPRWYAGAARGGRTLEPAVSVDEDAAYYRWAGGDKGYTFLRSAERDDFDRTLEYAGEISINHVVDLSLGPDQEIEIGPHVGEGPDNRVSIRVDLERKEPWRGQLSVDVGSLLGHDDWPGVKLARLLAWGNMLRCQREGEQPVYSHMRYHFDQPVPVDPGLFGDVVAGYRQDLELRQRHPHGPIRIADVALAQSVDSQ